MLREVYGYIISFSFFRPLCLLRILCYICIAVVIKGGMVLFPVSKMSVLEKCFQKQISQLWSVIKSSLKYSSVVKTVMVIVLYFVCLQTMVLNWFHVCCDPLRRSEVRATEGYRRLCLETTQPNTPLLSGDSYLLGERPKERKLSGSCGVV